MGALRHGCSPHIRDRSVVRRSSRPRGVAFGGRTGIHHHDAVLDAHRVAIEAPRGGTAPVLADPIEDGTVTRALELAGGIAPRDPAPEMGAGLAEGDDLAVESGEIGAGGRDGEHAGLGHLVLRDGADLAAETRLVAAAAADPNSSMHRPRPTRARPTFHDRDRNSRRSRASLIAHRAIHPRARPTPSWVLGRRIR